MNKIKEHLDDYTNVMKSLQMKSNSKHRTEKRKAKDAETRKTKRNADKNLYSKINVSRKCNLNKPVLK